MAIAPAPRTRLLVVDDDETSRRLIKSLFTPQGFEVLTASDGVAGVDSLAHQPDVILLDLHMPRMGGLEALQRIHELAPSIPVVILTASIDVKDAVQAMQLGAHDYLTKPVEPEEVIVIVKRALETLALRREVQQLRERVGRGDSDTLAAQMGESEAVRQIIEQVETVAASNFSVLVLGETGTGKELVAQAIHRRSDRHAKPFVALDCGAIPEALLESELFGHERGAFTGAERRRTGRFQLAEKGTCFLDEIGNLPLSLQTKLLRVLESKQLDPVGSERSMPIDVRFVAATNHDLRKRIDAGLFRADLYFRVAQYTITLPPLRERAGDIPYLADRFVREVSVELRRPIRSVDRDALELLRRHPWPGNVRELRNVLRQAVLISKEFVVRAKDVRPLLAAGSGAAGTPPRTEGQSLREVAEQAARAAERDAIREALRAARGNKSEAARQLRTDYKTLHVKIKQLGIDARDFGA